MEAYARAQSPQSEHTDVNGTQERLKLVVKSGPKRRNHGKHRPKSQRRLEYDAMMEQRERFRRLASTKTNRPTTEMLMRNDAGPTVKRGRVGFAGFWEVLTRAGFDARLHALMVIELQPNGADMFTRIAEETIKEVVDDMYNLLSGETETRLSKKPVRNGVDIRVLCTKLLRLAQIQRSPEKELKVLELIDRVSTEEAATLRADFKTSKERKSDAPVL